MASLTNLLCLISAIVQVESRDSPATYGSRWNTPPNAVGAAGGAQIKPIQVRDMNRICQYQYLPFVYTAADRYNAGKTRMVMVYWFRHYERAWERKYGRPATVREMSAWWRVGYRASQKPSRVQAAQMREYWAKIEKKMEGGK